MAQYLHWHVDEVKLYAYWYMHQLHYTSSASTVGDDKGFGKVHRKNRKISLIDAKGNNQLPGDGETEDDVGEWSYQECILFDTLLATYGPDDNGHEGDQQPTKESAYVKDSSSMRWKKISAMIPNKTSTQCCAYAYSTIITESSATLNPTTTEIPTSIHPTIPTSTTTTKRTIYDSYRGC